jgi:hypothetical protein
MDADAGVPEGPSGMDGLPIVAMSADRADHKGMDDAISKPVDPRR